MIPAASEGPKLGLAAFALATVLAAVQLGASCTEGVTPDCSDPAVCAPSEGDAAHPEPDGSVIPEGGPDTDASNTDAEAGLDAADADVEGG